MTNTALKAQIESQITNETTPLGITPTEVGGNLKDIVDYVDQEKRQYLSYCVEITQSGTLAPTVVVFENSIGIDPVWTRTGVGDYKATFTGEAVNTWMIPNDYCQRAGGTNKVDISISTSGGNSLVIQSYVNDVQQDSSLGYIVLELRKYI